jgi:hypothetical protein
MLFLAIRPEKFPLTSSPNADLAVLFPPGISSAAEPEKKC